MQHLRQLDAERALSLPAEVTLDAESLPVSELSQAELLESELTDMHMPLLPESELLEHRMKAPDVALCSHDCWADMDLAFGQGSAKSCSCGWGWVAAGLGGRCQGQALG